MRILQVWWTCCYIYGMSEKECSTETITLLSLTNQKQDILLSYSFDYDEIPFFSVQSKGCFQWQIRLVKGGYSGNKIDLSSLKAEPMVTMINYKGKRKRFVFLGSATQFWACCFAILST